MHAHVHSHGNTHGRLGSVLLGSLALTVLFVTLEAAAGVQSRSLALISDAGHNFTDALALLLAVFGHYVQQRPADEYKTFGYHRASVLAAFVNSLALLALSGYIYLESYNRFRNPEPVGEYTMLVVAGLGLVVNAVIMWGLHREQEHDLNVRAAFLHMMGDALGSVGIIAGALTLRQTGWLWIDPALSVLIATLIVWSAWDIIRETLNILLEGLPKGLNLQSVAAAMTEVEGVTGVHDLHIWTLGSHAHALSCHVVIQDMPPSESEGILRRLNQMLCDRFRLHHTTIQFEHAGCALSETGCTMFAHHPHEH
jgi:cobalt-zinc-cadmium efflux system protein